ncbi:8617_t:CDS:2 [Cetraspora pellucida]|uniref:8617_t:CDS:1 n=1 Tax=Cetraspora pellucida TaxID=1433469 RepID=A0A9N9HE13_9GLOM|nr:8617_t:CDS:2 [Cetraspora pellucida]
MKTTSPPHGLGLPMEWAEIDKIDDYMKNPDELHEYPRILMDFASRAGATRPRVSVKAQKSSP